MSMARLPRYKPLACCLASFGLYPLSNQLAVGRAATVPALAIDAALPFWPWSVGAYASLYPQMALQWWLLAAHPAARLRLLQALTAANLVGSLIFLRLPTTVPRPVAANGPGAALLRLIWRLDPPHNAFPSLHTTFALLVLAAHAHARTRWRGRIAMWSLAIIGSTLTTRQHRSLDVLGGAGLALGLYCWFFTRPRAKHNGIMRAIASWEAFNE